MRRKSPTGRHSLETLQEVLPNLKSKIILDEGPSNPAPAAARAVAQGGHAMSMLRTVPGLFMVLAAAALYNSAYTVDD